MKKFLFAFTALLIGSWCAFAQPPYKVYTSPKLPVRDALERMNLQVAWNTRVTVDGNRDGILSVQLLPGATNQLVVQTYKGAIFLYDADTGDLIWKTRAGEAFWSAQPAAFNTQSIFVTRRNMLYVLNRYDGSQRVYTLDPVRKRIDFGYPLLFTPNAAPVADENFLYLSMGDRLSAIVIPDFAGIERARKHIEKLKKEGKPILPTDEDYVPEGPDSPQPDFYWGYKFATQFLATPPLVYGEQLSMLTTDGVMTSVGRFGRGPREELFEFKLIGKSPAAAAQYRNIAYVGSDDFNVYAINMNNGRLAWRHVSGAPILIPPVANDADVFVSPKRTGLRRLDRLTGREMWTNRDTERFLAANPAYVYALDHIGKFYVVDMRRGTTLATHDLSDWAISIANEWTDRIYLAANDGQVLCLRHRDFAKPLVMRTPDVLKVREEKKPKEEPKKEEKKEEEKKDDKDKAARRPFELPEVEFVAIRADGGTAPKDDRRWRAGR